MGSGAEPGRADDPEGRHALARKRVAATVLVTDPAGRVLVVNPTYKPRWELPGGAVEADESPGAGGRREIAEELGVDLELGRLLVLDYVPATDTRTEGLIVVFDGGQLADLDDVVLPADELSDAAFVDLDTLETYLPDLLARRARSAVAARAAGTVAYLEDGRSPLTPTNRRAGEIPVTDKM